MDPVIGMGVLGALGGVAESAGNARQAALNRRFQERLSSTAAQRAVKDYRAAGLNPALAYERPASSPSGSQATVTDPIGKGVTSAMAAQQLRANVALTNAQTEKARAEAESANVDAAVKSGRLALPEGAPTYLDELLAGRRSRIRDANFGGSIQPLQLRKAQLENLLLDRQVPARDLQALVFGGARDMVGWADRQVRLSLDGASASARAWASAFESYRRRKDAPSVDAARERGEMRRRIMARPYSPR